MSDRKNHGFTLIEVIIVLVIAAILGVMMVQFTRTSTLFAVRPAIWFNNQTTLHEMMEKVTTKYKREIDADTLSLASLKNYIETDSDVKTYVSSSQTGFISFSSSGSQEYSASSISSSQGSSSILVVTLEKDDQSLRAMFVE